MAKHPNVHVRLVGQNGNAFVILGLCNRAAKAAGLSQAERDTFMAEATAGDYDHLLQTAVRWVPRDLTPTARLPRGPRGDLGAVPVSGLSMSMPCPCRENRGQGSIDPGLATWIAPRPDLPL